MFHPSRGSYSACSSWDPDPSSAGGRWDVATNHAIESHASNRQQRASDQDRRSEVAMALTIPPTASIEARARLECTQLERAREQYERVRFERSLRDQAQLDEQSQLERAQQQHALE